MRGLTQFDEQGNMIAPALTAQRADEFVSRFSGFANTATVSAGMPATPYTTFFPLEWERSGRLIVDATGDGRISSFYQPVFDTWTDSYATDSYDQEGFAVGTSLPGGTYGVEIGGVTPGLPTFGETRKTQITPSNGSPTDIRVDRNVVVRRWSSMSSTFNNSGQFADQSSGAGQSISQVSPTPLEVTPPISEPLRAIKISIRLDDFAAETIRQQTVIQEF